MDCHVVQAEKCATTDRLHATVQYELGRLESDGRVQIRRPCLVQLKVSVREGSFKKINAQEGVLSMCEQGHGQNKRSLHGGIFLAALQIAFHRVGIAFRG